MSDIKLVGCEALKIENATQVAEIEKADIEVNESTGFLRKNTKEDTYSVVVDQDKLKADTKYADAYKKFMDSDAMKKVLEANTTCKEAVAKAPEKAADPAKGTTPLATETTFGKHAFFEYGLKLSLGAAGLGQSNLLDTPTAQMALFIAPEISFGLNEDNSLRLALAPGYERLFGGEATFKNPVKLKPGLSYFGETDLTGENINNDDATSSSYGADVFRTDLMLKKIWANPDSRVSGYLGGGVGYEHLMYDDKVLSRYNSNDGGEYGISKVGNADIYKARLEGGINIDAGPIGIGLGLEAGVGPSIQGVKPADAPERSVTGIGWDAGLQIKFSLPSRESKTVTTTAYPEDKECKNADLSAYETKAKEMKEALFNGATIKPEWRAKLIDMGLPEPIIDTLDVKVKLVPTFGGKEGREVVGSELRAIFVTKPHGIEKDLVDRSNLGVAGGTLTYVDVPRLKEWDELNSLKKKANDGKAEIRKAFDTNAQAKYSTGRPTAKELGILAQITDKATFEAALVSGYRGPLGRINAGLVSNFSDAQQAVTKVAAEITKYKADLKDTEIKFHGTTDTRGSETSNQALSDRRAKLLAMWYDKNGVAKINGYGTGEAPPLPCNETGKRGADLKQCQQQNRATSIEFGDDAAGAEVTRPGREASDIKVRPIDLQKNMALSESKIEKSHQDGQACSQIKVSALVHTMSGSVVKITTLDAPILKDQTEDKAKDVLDPKAGEAPISSDKDDKIDVPAQSAKLKANSEAYGKELETIKKLPRTTALEKQVVDLRLRKLANQIGLDLSGSEELKDKSGSTSITDLATAMENLDKAKAAVKAYREELKAADEKATPAPAARRARTGRGTPARPVAPAAGGLD